MRTKNIWGSKQTSLLCRVEPRYQTPVGPRRAHRLASHEAFRPDLSAGANVPHPHSKQSQKQESRHLAWRQEEKEERGKEGKLSLPPRAYCVCGKGHRPPRKGRSGTPRMPGVQDPNVIRDLTSPCLYTSHKWALTTT